MTTLASDNFNRADNTTLGANWTETVAIPIVSNELSAVTTGNQLNMCRYTAASPWPNEQWAQLAIGTTVTTVADFGIGPLIRGQAAGDRIVLQGNNVDTRVKIRVSSVWTQVGTTGPAVATGDVLYLGIQGTTLTAKKNGTHICGSPIDISANGHPASGDAGIHLVRQTGGGTLSADNWEGGDFTGGGFAPSRAINSNSIGHVKPVIY